MLHPVNQELRRSVRQAERGKESGRFIYLFCIHILTFDFFLIFFFSLYLKPWLIWLVEKNMATKQHEPYTTQLSPDQPSPDEEKSHNAKDTKQYKLPTWRKCIILFVVSWMTLAVTFSSTSFLPATPEIAAEFGTTTEILNATNAGVLLAMGFSSLIWGPVGNLIGRKYAYNIAIFVLCGCSAGAAAAINMCMFTTMRILAGLTGTSFMVSGQTIIADIFEPVFPSSICLPVCLD